MLQRFTNMETKELDYLLKHLPVKNNKKLFRQINQRMI
mgnify:CR=1 FL=1